MLVASQLGAHLVGEDVLIPQQGNIGIQPVSYTHLDVYKRQLVTPAQAGVQFVYPNIRERHWIPACAGITVWEVAADADRLRTQQSRRSG